MSVSTLVRDLETTVQHGSTSEAGEILSRLTDLFVATAPGMAEDQVGVFDIVIGRLARAIEVQARVELSARLAAVPNAPIGVVRQLALDVIAVARPVLVQSPRLSEQDLVAICATRGRDHMLAVSERADLGEAATDFLILRGDRVVTQAVAANQTARFSRHGIGVLVMRAVKDELLQQVLTARADLPAELAAHLLKVAKASARRRLEAVSAPGLSEAIAGAVERGAERVASDPATTSHLGRFASAVAAIHALHEAGRLDEAAVCEFASLAAIDHTVCAVAILARLPLPLAEQQLFGTDREPVLMLARALGFSWTTTAVLLALRPGESARPTDLERIRQGFEGLEPGTARRILAFLQLRDTVIENESPEGVVLDA